MGEVTQKGMAELKQVVISMVIVLIAALILVGMVGYTVILLRAAQLKLLTGEPIAYAQRGAACILRRLCLGIVRNLPEIYRFL